LDPTFGTDGQVIVSFGPSEERPSSAVLQPDGKIVVGGTLFGGGQSQFLVARFDATGALDPTFGSGGSVTTMGNGPNDQLRALLLQPDGKVVAVRASRHRPLCQRRQPRPELRHGRKGRVDDRAGRGRRLRRPAPARRQHRRRGGEL
jgi:uncharacterized delta-60 repeat protein